MDAAHTRWPGFAWNVSSGLWSVKKMATGFSLKFSISHSVLFTADTSIFFGGWLHYTAGMLEKRVSCLAGSFMGQRC